MGVVMSDLELNLEPIDMDVDDGQRAPVHAQLLDSAVSDIVPFQEAHEVRNWSAPFVNLVLFSCKQRL